MGNKNKILDNKQSGKFPRVCTSTHTSTRTRVRKDFIVRVGVLVPYPEWKNCTSTRIKQREAQPCAVVENAGAAERVQQPIGAQERATSCAPMDRWYKIHNRMGVFASRRNIKTVCGGCVASTFRNLHFRIHSGPSVAHFRAFNAVLEPIARPQPIYTIVNYKL